MNENDISLIEETPYLINFNIDGTNASDLTFRIVKKGKIECEKVFSESPFSVDLSFLSFGEYFYQVTNGENVYLSGKIFVLERLMKNK